MIEGDEPEVDALVSDSEGENPDVYWSDPLMGASSSYDLAMGLASWRFDGHVDGTGDL